METQLKSDNGELTMNLDNLLGIMKPARYTGGEWNSTVKDFDSSGVKFALGFPDLYEVGMSNLGIRILYGALNAMEDVLCERFFAPAADMERLIRSGGWRMQSLENRRELAAFDMVGFSLGYELNYPDVLNILDLAGIPLRAEERGCGVPLVIGGGPCAVNPEPVSDFFDLFIIGEAEEALPELISLYRRHSRDYKEGRMGRDSLLAALASVEGVYVPSLYDVVYAPDGSIVSFSPKSPSVPARVKKRFVKDMDSSFFPGEWIVPYIQIVHDRITLEIMRGCPNRCRFCQARHQYYPLRFRGAGKVGELAAGLYKNTGYHEISFSGLSISDYPGIEKLAASLMAEFRDRCVSISLPSIKPKSFLGELSKLIAGVRKTGLTFAPEAGTRRMREILGKDFDEEVFRAALLKAFSAGYQHVKLYFLTGIPGESDSDLDGIKDLAAQVSELRRGAAGRPAEVHLSVNTLIPKPHTPLQWFPMESMDSMLAKRAYIKRAIGKNRRLKAVFHDPALSLLEGIFSRGDRRLGRVIEAVFRSGVRLDNWKEEGGWDKWAAAFTASSLEMDFYLRKRSLEDILPWDFIDIGAGKEALVQEFNKVVAMEEDK